MRNLLLSTAIVTATAMTGAAHAQSMNSPFVGDAVEGAIQASDLIGMRIYTVENGGELMETAGQDPDWNDIGEVHDIVMSRDGQVRTVLLDIGGFLGIGERQVGVSLDQIKFVSDSATEDDPEDFFLVVNANDAMLKDAPEYRIGAAMERTADSVAVKTENAAKATGDAMKKAADDTAAAAHTAKDRAITATAETAAKAETAMDNAGTKVGEAMDKTVAATRPEFTRDGYDTADNTKLTSEELTGARVYDGNDKWIGEISELVLTDNGKISEAIIDVGGFLGMGEKPVALSIDDLNILRNDNEVVATLSMTEEQLKELPTYEK